MSRPLLQTYKELVADIMQQVVTYGAVFYNIFIVQDNMPGALEILQGFGRGFIHLSKLCNQQC